MASVEYLQNGRYALLKKLGEGGKGVVFKARDTVLNRVVAVKMLKSAVTSEEVYSRFMSEAQAVAKLNHPNVVTIHDIGKEDGKQFFVLEFVDGESLRDLMQTYPEGKCDIQTVLRVGMDVCNALQYAHSEKVLHRDIKPENVMITRDGTAKLMDFGLAKMIGQQSVTQEGVIVGTVAYVAPEATLGKAVDARSDLYSLGAVLYEALSGKPPFSGDDPIKIIFGHIHDHPVPLAKQNPEAPQALADCTMKLLEKEPEKRYQSAEDLLKILREISEEFLRETLVPGHKSNIVVPTPRPVAAREIQLIDRVEEMRLLREAVDRTIRGEGGLIFLCGEAGIGKTRLTRELRAYARLRGMQILYGRCPALFRMDGVPPYVLWSEVLRDYLEASSPEQLYRVVGFYPAEVAKLVPELKQRLAAFPQSLPISPEHERERLFEAVSQFITNVSREGPLLVILDDLQWTDQTSLLLMHYLARGIHKSPLLLLGAYRETDVDEKHPLSPVLTELNRERLLQSVSLKRMSSNDISEMIKRILEQDEVPKEFYELIYGKTRGNPFYVEEVVKSLREDEVIFRVEDKWEFKQVSKIEFPKTVKGVIRARINRLDDECQNILTMASFVGNDFSFEALHAVTGIEENKLLELMEKLLRTGLVKESVIRGQDIYCFADVIVRDVVHEEVSHLRHNKLHFHVGNALEKVYGKNIDQHFGELAYHFLEGGDKDKALQYFLKAGEKAQKIYAHSEACSYLEHALTLLEEKEDTLEQIACITEKLGDIKTWTGEIEAGMKDYGNSLTLSDRLGDKRSASRIHVKMAHALWDEIGDKEKASKHHRMALEILEKEPESVELACLYEDVSRMLWRSGESTNALSLTNKAFQLAEKLGSSEVLARCYSNLGVFCLHSGEFEKAAEYLEHGLKIAMESSLMEPALRLHTNLSIAYESVGDFQRSFDTGQAGYQLAKKVGDVHSLSWHGLEMAGRYGAMGKMQEAFSMAEEVLALNKRTKNTVGVAQTITGLGWGYWILGEWDKSLQYLREGRDLAKKTGEYQEYGWATLLLGELFMEMGDYTEAETYINEANSINEKAGDTDRQFAEVFPALSRLHLKKGEIEKAKELVAKTDKYVTKTKNIVNISYAEMLKAMLFREQKDWKQSIQHFEKSLQGYKSVNSQKWRLYQFAWLMYEYGLMYLDRNEEDDKEKAYSLLDQALTLFQKMDAKKRIEEIIAKKKLLTA